MPNNKGKKNQVQDGSKKKSEDCIVCFKSLEICSVGECDHPVCFECSTRMRVLLSVKECPICRKEMANVSSYDVFSFTNLLPFIG